MGNNSSSLQSKTSSTNMGKSNDLINKLFEHNNVDSLNMTEFNTNKGGSSIPVIRVSHLPQIGGAVQPVANKYSNEFINNMNKNRIFNLIHDTEIQEYHLNNMVKQGILNNNATATTNTMTGGYVPPTNATNTTNVNESDVSDAMNRIKEVIVNELKEQELKGGANNNASDSNTDGCGCGGNDGDKKKHGNKCEYGKKKKSKKSKGKTYESSMTNSDNSSSSSSSSSSSDNEDGAINSNNGLSIFPFNSSDVSDKNYRLQRRKK